MQQHITAAHILLCFLISHPFSLWSEPEPVSIHPPTTVSEVGTPWLMESGETETAASPMAEPMDAPQGTTFYDHGNPTVYEQLMLEWVNRARANPGAEAARLEIDLNEGLDPGTIEDTPKPPLAIHPLILQASRDHSDWMLDTNTFSHTGVNDSDPGDRMVTAGYVFSGSWTWGENIAWNGTSGTVDPIAGTLTAHDGLFISPGHRVNLMEAGFDEMSPGIRLGQFHDGANNWNALMVTQKFARSGDTPSPFAVGAVYYDFNDDAFYNVGEGIQGVDIQISGADFHTTTGQAGGYALPVPATGGTRDVTFTASGISHTLQVTFPAGENHKVDLVPQYIPPILNGPDAPIVNTDNPYTFPRVFGADAYRVSVQSREPALTDSPSDLSRVVDGTSPDYTPLSSATKYSGTHAYQLAHFGLSTETLTYIAPFQVTANAALRFRSRLRYATTDQIAQVRLSTNGGQSWTVVYQQPGSGDAGESTFSLREIDLTSYEGSEIQLAFAYVFADGGYYSGASSSVGWFIDDVEFINLQEIETLNIADLGAADDFLLHPAEADTALWLQVTPRHQGADWPAGPALQVTPIPANDYHVWAADLETLHNLPAGTLTHDPHGDLSGDGTTNSIAFALGLDPTQTVTGADLPHFASALPEYHFWERDDSPWNLIPEISINLQNWYAWDDPNLPGTASLQLQQSENGLTYYALTPDSNLGNTVLVRLRLQEKE